MHFRAFWYYQVIRLAAAILAAEPYSPATYVLFPWTSAKHARWIGKLASPHVTTPSVKRALRHIAASVRSLTLLRRLYLHRCPMGRIHTAAQ